MTSSLRLAHRTGGVVPTGRWQMWRAWVPVVLILVASAGWAAWQFWPSPGQKEVVVVAGDGASPTASVAVVYVSGAVASPGLQTLPMTARVGEAVAAAGGLLADADATQVNLARIIADGEHIHIPMKSDPASSAARSPGSGSADRAQTGEASSGTSTQVNLNTATAEELQTLPRIGPATAQKIIDYRTEHGPFTSVEQLLQIPGIGERTLSNLKSHITV